MEDAFYERYAALEDEHWWFRARRRIIAEVVGRHAPQARGGAVLDVGCGTGGTLAHVLAPMAARALGVDGETSAVEQARRRGVEAQHVVGLPEVPLPFEDGAFDLTTAFDVIEHVADDGALLREMRRVTRPGGAVVVTVPAFQLLWGQQDVVSHHHRRYSPSALKRVLAASDLQLVHFTGFNTVLFPAVAAVRLARRARPGAAPAAAGDFDTGPSGGLAGRVLERLMSAEARPAAGAGLPVGVSLLAVARVGPS